MYKITTAVKKIRAMKARKKVIPGSSSAGKTIAILIILIDMCTKRPNLEVSVVSESIPHLKKGALKDFLKIMKATGRFNAGRYNATDRKYTFANGAYIEFFSPESVIGSRRNVLYINEANYIKYDDYHQMAIRTSDEIFIDFNPANEFWAHTEVAREANAEIITLTYLDNESRPSNVDEEFAIAMGKAEKEKAQGLPITSFWQNWCRVYVHGLTGNLQGVIFNNWNQTPDVPTNAQLIAYGLDWGFSNDQTGIVAVYRWNDNLILHELLYETNLTNSQLVVKMKALKIRTDVDLICDSAEPKSIQDLRNMGFGNAVAAKKGPDSVRASINKLQEFSILVTEESQNLIKELRGYMWQRDTSGAMTGKPIDHNNHLIDPTLYVVLNKFLIKGYTEFL